MRPDFFATAPFLLSHITSNQEIALAKPKTSARAADRGAAFPALGASEVPVPGATVGPPVAVAVAMQVIVCVESAGGNQLAKAGWKS